MIRDITIGQYYNCNSLIHAMDPRTKILWTLFYMVLLFVIDSPVSYAVIILLSAVMIGASHIPLRFILKGLKPILFLVIFTALLNLFLTNEGKVLLFKGSAFAIHTGGVELAAKMAIRIILLIMGSSLLTLTTTPTVLTSGMESLLLPLKKIGVPISAFVMMISIALRFIPTLLDETDKIMKAQAARGANFDSGNIVEKVKALVPLLVPLFLSAFQRADELAIAMEARCYHGGVNRTRLKALQYMKRDLFVAGICVCMALLAICSRMI